MAIQEQYSKYHITPFWANRPESYRDLEYIQEEFNDADNLALWNSQGYGPKYVGWMCDMRNPQPSWNNQFVEFFEKYQGWKDIGTSYYRMDARSSLPNHVDPYKRYIDLFNLKGQEHRIRRALVLLEDWKSGHYLEVNNEPIVQWKAGDFVKWTNDTHHLAANLGIEARYTIQITYVDV